MFALYLKRKEKRYITFHQQDMFNLAERRLIPRDKPILVAVIVLTIVYRCYIPKEICLDLSIQYIYN